MLMAMTFAPMPVFMRIGNGEEFEVGTVTPEADLDVDAGGEASLTLKLPPSLIARALREAADEVEAAGA
jgi:hypothetical protein